MLMYVCTECIPERGIRDFIEGNRTSKECSYCDAKSTSPIAADLDDVADYINSCIAEEYDDAVNHLFYDSGEGGYQGEHCDTYDLLVEETELDLPKDGSGELLFALIERLPDKAWCDVAPYTLDDNQIAQYSWEHFCNVIRHQRRFFFSSSTHPYDREIYSPGKLLEHIIDYAQDLGLFITLPISSTLYRAREQGQLANLKTAQQLGPPPIKYAIQSNRMSPPGIVMFYGSNDTKTALREIVVNPGTFAVGEFQTCRSATILDLCAIPQVPSLFEAIPDSLEYRPRRIIKFLSHVAAEMSKPIARDGQIHIEYIPTQVATEYVREQTLWGGQTVDGIKYPSSVHPGQVSYVLFATQENLLPIPQEIDSKRLVHDDRWLKLVSSDPRVVTKEQIASWDRWGKSPSE